MSLDRIAAAAGPLGLAVLGALHPGPGDGAPEGCGTLVLLGPDGGRLWPIFRAGPEFADGGPDALDRWSTRVIGELALRLGAAAVFPFDGPPHAPFTAWARRSGQAWISPVGLLVHASQGLFVSFRGALAFASSLELPAPGRRPCDGCPAPCLAACPAGALTARGYDLRACHGFLLSAAGAGCMGRGCAVRRACPVGEAPAPEQAAFHMAAFHGKWRGCDG
jgi:hypothetical protein